MIKNTQPKNYKPKIFFGLFIFIIFILFSVILKYNINTIEKQDVVFFKSCEGNLAADYEKSCKNPIPIYIKECIKVTGHRNENLYCEFLPEWLDSDDRLVYDPISVKKSLALSITVHYSSDKNGYQQGEFSIEQNSKLNSYRYSAIESSVTPNSIYMQIISYIERDFLK